MKKLFKAIYEAIPLKKQLFSLIRPFHPSEKIYQHLHFHGVFKVKVDGSSFKVRHYGYQIENELFWTGFSKWEPVSLELWKKLSKRSNVIIDIGANTGIYSLIAGAINKSATIYAFEPLTYSHLLENVKLNSFNIKASNTAISNVNGEASFFTNSTDFSYTASLNKEHQSSTNKNEIKVKTQTLDSFCEGNNIIPDLVKIDVERHEPEVIEGFLKTIKRSLPTMLIEVLDENIGNRLRVLLKDTPYQYYSINDAKGTCQQMPDMGVSEDFNVLVCTKEVAATLGI